MVEARIIDFEAAVLELEPTRKRRVKLPHKTIQALAHFVHDVWDERQSVAENELWLEELDHSLQKTLYFGKDELVTSRQLIDNVGNFFIHLKRSHQVSNDTSSALLDWDKKFVSAGGLKDPDFAKKVKEAAKR